MDKNYEKVWFIKEELVKTNYTVIENLQQFIVQDVPQLHPEHPLYTQFWSKESKKCIEGIWGNEFGKYRYMPGNLYYFGNYGIIEHTFEVNAVKVTEDIKPFIIDYLWDYAYSSWVCYGFSGFEKDDNYSSNVKLLNYYKQELVLSELPITCINSKGEAKVYIDPFEYISKLHSNNLGKPLFQNPTQNFFLLGSRGSSKSYWSAIGEIEYNFVFGGARRYDQKFIDGLYKVQQCCGAGDTNKSSEMLQKFLHSQNAKTNGENDTFKKWFGIWVEFDSKGNTVTTPCPFYKRTLGTLECPNKQPNKIYRAKYKVDINGEWIERGTGSSVAHVNYSTKKGDGYRAAEGGRYIYSVVEEVGSLETAIEVLGANEGTVSRGGNRIGVQWFQGTSGHIEYIQSSKKVFLDPRSYNMLTFKNQFGTSGSKGEIGYFVPYYITQLDCKDANGNTDYKKAISKVNKEREEYANSADPRVLRDFLMNKPCYVDEMWLTDKGYYLPYEEAALREKQLMAFDYYRTLENCVKLKWDSTKPRGIDYEILHTAEPYRDFPIDTAKKKDPSGCIVIYEFPQEINGHIPNDLYQFMGLDPYVEENIDRGGSVAAFYIIMNPKYIPFGYKGNTIVASYVGKPIEGLDHYYENLEKLIQFYGNPMQGLCYEKNRGESCRAHFIKKHKVNLLMPTPNQEQGSNMYQKNITSFGYNVGNRLVKIPLTKMVNDWLLEETELADGKKKNIERIPCLYLIRQIMQYNIDDNFDAVDGFRGAIINMREYQNKQIAEATTKAKKTSDFKGILSNERIFKKYKSGRFSAT